MADHVRVPVKMLGTERWAQLSAFGDHHLVCGEEVREKNSDLTFAGGHRVRLYSFKKNVHWKIPSGVPLDIASVSPANPPRRHQR